MLLDIPNFLNSECQILFSYSKPYVYLLVALSILLFTDIQTKGLEKSILNCYASCVLQPRGLFRLALKIPNPGTLKEDPSQAHLCFCLHTRILVLYFTRSLSKHIEFTLKLLKVVKQTSNNTTYSDAIRFRFTIQFL